jgi:hypothetical protein
MHASSLSLRRGWETSELRRMVNRPAMLSRSLNLLNRAREPLSLLHDCPKVELQTCVYRADHNALEIIDGFIEQTYCPRGA